MAEQGNSYLEGDARHNLDERTQNNAKGTDWWLIYLSRDVGRALRRGKDEVGVLVDSAKTAFGTTRRVTKKMVWPAKRNRSPSSNEEVLFHELGSMVRQCADGDYSSLQYNVEFWQVVKQLHSVRRKVRRKVATREEPREEETSKVSHEGPAEISQEVPEEILEKEDAPEGATTEEPRIAVPSNKRNETRKSNSRQPSRTGGVAVDSTTRAAAAKKRSAESKPTSTARRKRQGKPSTEG